MNEHLKHATSVLKNPDGPLSDCDPEKLAAAISKAVNNTPRAPRFEQARCSEKKRNEQLEGLGALGLFFLMIVGGGLSAKHDRSRPNSLYRYRGHGGRKRRNDHFRDTVPCPSCSSSVGEPCRTKSGKVMLYCHAPRQKSAEKIIGIEER